MQPTPRMIEIAARAMCEAWHYAPIGTPDGDAEWKRTQDHYRKQAEAALTAALSQVEEQEIPVRSVTPAELKYYSERFYGLIKALKDWPAMPEPYLLMQFRGEFPEDWDRGKRIQSEFGIGVVPPKTECEIGAGFWDRITDGRWRLKAIRALKEGCGK